MNKTKQNKTKHSLLCRYGLTSAAALLLTFGSASAVRADEAGRKGVQNDLQKQREEFPQLKEYLKNSPYAGQENTPIFKYLLQLEGKLNNYLRTLDGGLHHLQGDQGPAGERG
ncbi:TPA: hypothetical protein ACJ69T_001848, partial [Streptococcus pyogenes]